MTSPGSNDLCLQERYAPQLMCFGCGPANTRGLRIRSFAADNDEVVATWTPEPHHEAFPGMLNGGIIGTLMDCHCNWTAAYHLMKAKWVEHPPCTVTAEYSIQLRRPTPSAGPVHIRSQLVEIAGERATIEGQLVVDGKTCATCRGIFVAVQPGHPAYHRW